MAALTASTQAALTRLQASPGDGRAAPGQPSLPRETVLLAIVGPALGIAMTYGARWLIMTLMPTMIQAIAPD